MLAIQPSPLPSMPVHETFFDGVLERARQLGRRKVALVHPSDFESLSTARALVDAGIADVTLVGPLVRLREIAKTHGFDLTAFEWADSGTTAAEAAEAACRLAASGAVDMVMKGAIHSDELMRAVVSRSNGLRGSGRISHAFVVQLPNRPEPLIISDCVVNVAPTLTEKIEILDLVVGLARALGILVPRVALLSFTESVLPSAPSTVDAAVISKMAQRGQITGAIVDGPLAFDNAISENSATAKGIQSSVAGRANILLMPNLETGNALYKSLVYMAGGACAGLVLGTLKPVVLTSRTDSQQSKIFSVALGSLVLRH